ncbi:subtilisin-like protein [Ceratobasidium sp. AG-I]|nr:subtilisin-like protein [Ceratobasidium sp. AG-I]
MILPFTTVAALAVLFPVLGAPTSSNVPISKFPGTVKADSYIIKLKTGISKESHISQIISRFTSDSKLQYKYGEIFNGYAVTLKGKDLDLVRQSKDIEHIEEDGIMIIDNGRDNLPDMLERSIPQTGSLETRAACGAGVDIYGIDTGIYTAHSCFGGRAKWGATYGGYANADGNGHGTHTAGTAVGTTYGVAEQANIIAIKVLSDSGSGANSDVIAGINYAYNSYKASGRPSIATLSLGGGANTAVDSAVSNGITGGLHFTIAAGNSNVDAGTTSPARVAAANTIGACDTTTNPGKKASFSNYGSVVDVFGPGVNILSAWIGSTTATNTISGTSMATPFVAGILACAISRYGNKTPAALSADLKAHARPNCGGTPTGTTNLLATIW